MKKLIFSILLALVMSATASAKAIELKLWDDSSKYAPGEQPILYVYPAKKPCGTAIIMCPGGSYRFLSMESEGRDMAQWFNAMGITYAVLKYTLPKGNYELPFADAEQAMRIMRSHAQEWGFNPSSVGIMGASAGGHLASTLATHYTSAETRPDFQILFYPVITMEEGVTHAGSRKNLLGEKPSDELVKRFSNELRVNNNTPRAFIMASHNDKVVPIENSVRYYSALVKNGVNASLHIYPYGGHGWGYKDSFVYKRDWTGELEKWLRTVIINNNK